MLLTSFTKEKMIKEKKTTQNNKHTCTKLSQKEKTTPPKQD